MVVERSFNELPWMPSDPRAMESTDPRTSMPREEANLMHFSGSRTESGHEQVYMVPPLPWIQSEVS